MEKINKAKIKKAIDVADEFIAICDEKGVIDTGANVLSCVNRNASAYRDMLELDYVQELGSMRDLYMAM